MKKLFIFLTMLVLGIVSSWAIDVKIADYSSIQPWASSGAIINRSANKLTLTSTDASGVAGTTLVTSGGYWDRYDKWLQIVPGTTDEVTYTVTLTAPTGYTIVGYVIECCSWNANRTYVVTAADNTTVTTTNTAIQTLNVKNLDVTSTTFTVNGKATSSSNVYFTIKNMTVALVKKQGTRLNSTATGVTWNNNNDPTKWNNTWTSGTTPNIKLTCGTTWNSNLAGNMHRGNNVDGAFYLHTNNTPYYTLIMDGNYMITGYTIVGTASGDFDFTPTSGTADGSFKRQQTKAVHVTGLASNSVGFKVSPGGHAFNDATIYIEYETYTPVTSTNNTKSYYITTADRSSWVVASGATQVNATSKTGTIAGQKFAFIRYDDAKDDSNDGTYLYSVSEGKFISKSGSYTTLTEFPGDKVSVLTSENTKFPTVIALNGGSSHAGISNGYNPAVITSYNSLSDGGNCCAIIEADDFDATDVLAKIEDYFHPTHTITYIVKDGKGNVLFNSGAIDVPLGTYTLPSEYQRNHFYTYSAAEVTITGESAANTNLEVIATPKSTAIKYTANATAPEYYNLNIRSKYLVYDDEATGDVKLQDTSEPFSSDASWAFIGNPYDGFKMINKAKGTDKYLTYTSVVEGSNHDNNNIGFVADDNFTDQYWYIEDNTNGICLRMKNNTKIYFHHDNGNNFLRTCSVTEFSSVHNDPGSTIVFSTDEDVLFALFNNMKDWSFGTSIGQMNTTDASVITNEDATSTMLGIKSAILAEQTAAYPLCYNSLMTIKDHMSLVEPTAGFYRLKNVATGKYLTAVSGPQAYDITTRGVYASNSDGNSAASIIRLYAGNDGLYMYNQGNGFGWVVAGAEYGAGVGYLSTNPDKYVNWFPGKAANHIAFAICYGNGIDSWASYLEKGIYMVDTSDEAVIGGTDYKADAAQWIMEEATSVTISMNPDGATTPTYYATFCAPFSYTVSDGTTKAYTLEQSGEWLIPTEIKGEVAAGTPVLLKGSSATATLTIRSGYVGSPLTDTALTGTYLPKTIAGSTDYVLGKKDGKVGFYHWSSNNLAANRAYLAGSSNNARGFALMFDDDATGIVSTPGETEEGTTIYNLSGQRLNKMQKGINIVNGKKVLF